MRFIIGLVFVLSAAAKAYAIPSLSRVSMQPYTIEELALNAASYNFESIVALNNCSGSIVQFDTSAKDDKAVVMTNGHCFEDGFIDYNTVIVNKPSKRSFKILNAKSKPIGSVKATEVMYATMTKTDVAFYVLEKTYDEIYQKYKIPALTLARDYAPVGTGIEIISGYWKRGYSCKIDGFVFSLVEGEWTWADSIRYTDPGCEVIGGTSGSPILQSGTRTVIGINNTGNEDGLRCTDNNPCEVDDKGNVSVLKGINYGQQTSWVYSCLDSNRKIDLTIQGCLLPH